MDVDGTLTDGHIYMGPDGEAMKAFHVRDGYGIVALARIGIIPCIITGRKSKILENRAKELQIKHLYQGITDKLAMTTDLGASLGFAPEEIAYIGDDLNDLSCIEYCGLSACPSDAEPDLFPVVDYVCHHKGGEGAVREFIDYIIERGE